MSADSTPELVFRLIGTWWRLDLDSDDASRASATDIARGTLGARDQEATARRRMRDDLVSAAASARSAQARLLLLQTELSPGEPMSATLTVYDDERVRMSPAIGTQRRLVAQYWYPQPGTKKLALVVLSTPLGDIPNTLLSYFDAIVEASRLVQPVAAD